MRRKVAAPAGFVVETDRSWESGLLLLKVWDLESGRELRTLEGHGRAYFLRLEGIEPPFSIA